MRVRIAVHRYRPEVGGTELMAEMMATAMVRRGHDVEVVTIRTRPSLPEERLPLLTHEASDSDASGYAVRRLDYLGGPVRVPVGYWRALQEETDVLHVFGNRIWCSDFFLPIARFLPYPKVLTGQDFYQLHMHPGLLNRFYAHQYFPRMAEQVQCYVVQTDRERDQFRRFGFRGRIEKIPHTVDPREFPPDPGSGDRFRTEHGLGSRPIVLSAGGFAPNKRMDRVIEGVAAAKSRVDLVIAGGDWPGHAGDLRHCRDLAARLGVSVLFLGDGRSAPRDEVVRAFRACDVYAQGSSYEGYGGAVQEAMLVERPFVAFETGAIGEFASAGAGVAVRSVGEFASALDRLVGSDTERRTMGRLGRQDVLAHRAVDVTMDAYDRLFRELADGRADA